MAYVVNEVFFQQERTSSYVDCTRCKCQDVGSAGCCWVGLCEEMENTLCQTQVAPASSNTRHMWTQRWHWLCIWEQLFKKESEENLSQHSEEKSVRKKPANTKVREGCEGGALGHQWSWYFPAACGEDHAGADIHTAICGVSHAKTGGYALKELQPI